MSQHLRGRMRTTSSVRRSCTVTNGQLQVLDLLYGSDDLTEWNDLYGDDLSVTAFLTPDDLTHVGVEHPAYGHVIEVPCLDGAYARRLPILAHLDWLARTSPSTVIRVRDDLIDALDDRRRVLDR